MTGDSKVCADKIDTTYWTGYSSNGSRKGVPCGSGDKEEGGTGVGAGVISTNT